MDNLIGQTPIGKEVMLLGEVKARLDNSSTGVMVTLLEETIVVIRCTSLPGVSQVTIKDGKYAGKTAFINCNTTVNY
jgi:hypothetical protein